MSRAFVKEDDAGGDSPPERHLSDHPNLVTPRGLEQLRGELEALEAERLPLAPLAGADPGAADRLEVVDRELRYVRSRVESAILVDPAGQPAGEVAFGATVEARDGAGEKVVYRVVGEDEADPGAGLVSYVSPLAQVLLGARRGQQVVWRRPMGDLALTIESVSYE